MVFLFTSVFIFSTAFCGRYTLGTDRVAFHFTVLWSTDIVFVVARTSRVFSLEGACSLNAIVTLTIGASNRKMGVFF